MSESEGFINAKEAAQFLRLKSHKTVQEWARDGRLKGYPIRNGAKTHWLFRKSELDAWVTGAVERTSHASLSRGA